MRSTRKEPLEDMRKTIEPMFQAGASAENARYGRKDGSPEGITLELMWFGLRPAFVADSVDNVAVHAGLQSGIQLGVLTSPMVGTGSGGLNDNVPANTGIPTYQFSLASSAAGAGRPWHAVLSVCSQSRGSFARWRNSIPTAPACTFWQHSLCTSAGRAQRIGAGGPQASESM